jgi:acetylornithine deacetylase/succinyl-diaminopimelate desuccinylase-like protein
VAGVEAALAYLCRHRRRFVPELSRFLRFASISGDGRRRKEMVACASWLSNHMHGIGFDDCAVVPTAGAPAVIARCGASVARPTVLVYGHYDVQPVEPLHGWTTPPFAPALIDGRLVARGASDDKGQIFAHLKAMEAVIRTVGSLPVNVVCLFEGEEEIGSPNLGHALATLDGLRPDVIAVSDTRMLDRHRPVLTVALRGSVNVEIRLARDGGDLHAGAFGGGVLNAGHVLADVVSSLHDADGRVALDGFYDPVRPPSLRQRRSLAIAGLRHDELRAAAGGAPLTGEPGWSAFERTTVRPALVATGLCAGYCGPGSKNAVPATASARLNLRIVPDQQPADVVDVVRRHLARAMPSNTRLRLKVLTASPPVTLDATHPALEAAAEAYRLSFGRPAVRLPSGGSIPSLPILQRAFDAPIVLMGFGLPDDNMHAPDEHLDLAVFERATACCVHALHLFAELG